MENVELAEQDEVALVVAIIRRACEDAELVRVAIEAGCTEREARALLLAEVN